MPWRKFVLARYLNTACALTLLHCPRQAQVNHANGRQHARAREIARTYRVVNVVRACGDSFSLSLSADPCRQRALLRHHSKIDISDEQERIQLHAAQQPAKLKFARAVTAAVWSKDAREEIEKRVHVLKVGCRGE